MRMWSCVTHGRLDTNVSKGGRVPGMTCCQSIGFSLFVFCVPPRRHVLPLHVSLLFCLALQLPPQFAMSSGDRAALVALFRSTGGPHWRGKRNWDTDADLSRWSGVTVNDDGRVVKLDLYDNNLKGILRLIISL